MGFASLLCSRAPASTGNSAPAHGTRTPPNDTLGAFWPITRIAPHDYPRTDATPPACVGMEIANMPEYSRTDATPPACVGMEIVIMPEYSRTDVNLPVYVGMGIVIMLEYLHTNASVPVCGVTARASG